MRLKLSACGPNLVPISESFGTFLAKKLFPLAAQRGCGFRGQQRKRMSGFLTKLSKEGTVRHRQSKEASILWSHHEETRELPGERDNARNNATCTKARKATHGLDGQHQDVDRTLPERVNQNDRGQG